MTIKICLRQQITPSEDIDRRGPGVSVFQTLGKAIQTAPAVTSRISHVQT